MPTSEQRPPGPVIPVVEPWLALWRFTAAATWGGLSALVQLSDPRPLRTFWSTALSRAADRAMRSPEFLELTAVNLRAMASLMRLNPLLRSR
jgi:hypothetical protein